MSFKKDNYLVIKKTVSKELIKFIYDYFLLKRNAVSFLYKNNYINQCPILGTWDDTQIPNTYSHYADMVMETLLIKILPLMKKHTKLKLIPTYSYARIYKKGDKLKKHKDRSSCEISTTLNLGGDPWPIYLDPTGADTVIDELNEIHKPICPVGIEVNLNPGEMLIYRGCMLEHWRKPFEGEICSQVFLHYNDANGSYKNNLFDNRPMLGLPPKDDKK